MRFGGSLRSLSLLARCVMCYVVLLYISICADTVQTVAAQINEAVHDSERATELVRVQKSFSGKVRLCTLPAVRGRPKVPWCPLLLTHSLVWQVELVSPGRRLLIEDGPFYLQRVSSPGTPEFCSTTTTRTGQIGHVLCVVVLFAGQEEEVRLFLFSDLLLCGAPVPSSKKIKFKMHTKVQWSVIGCFPLSCV